MSALDARVADAVHRLRAACAALPETSEEEAWTGTRWVVRTKNFAHVVAIADGRPAEDPRGTRHRAPPDAGRSAVAGDQP